MPRGHRKRGQYALKIWTPRGAIVEFATTKDLDVQTWQASLRDSWAHLERIAKRADAPVARKDPP